MSPPAPKWSVREACLADRDVIVDFNASLALETEGKTLDVGVLTTGVEAALQDRDRLRYWLAAANGSGTVAGQAAISREWSDWRNGWLWWFQSVYVRPEFRRHGVFRILFETIRQHALASPDVIGLRLYVENENRKAQETYQTLGMTPGGYHIYEELWRERFGPRGAPGS